MLYVCTRVHSSRRGVKTNDLPFKNNKNISKGIQYSSIRSQNTDASIQICDLYLPVQSILRT